MLKLMLFLYFVFVFCIDTSENYSNNWTSSLSWKEDRLKKPWETSRFYKWDYIPYHKYKYPYYGVEHRLLERPKKENIYPLSRTWNNNWAYPRKYYKFPSTTRPWKWRWTYYNTNPLLDNI